MRRRLLSLTLTLGLVGGGFLSLTTGCGSDEPAEEPTPPEPDGPRVHGLTPAQAAETVATVGEREITAGEIANELASKGSFVRTRYASPERRREFLDQMIRFELLAQEAARRGYEDLPEVQRTRKQMMIRRFLAERFDEGGPASITGEQVSAYYDAHSDEFNTPEQVRASHIQFRDRATAARVLRELAAHPDDLQLFRRMAQEHNQDPATRERFGDLRFFSRPAEGQESPVAAAVAEAAFSIEAIGGVHPEVVRSDSGFHVVKLTARRAEMRRSLADATRTIRNRLWREQRESSIQELMDELRGESDVEENLEALQHLQLDLPNGDVPSTTQLPTPPPQGDTP